MSATQDKARLRVWKILDILRMQSLAGLCGLYFASLSLERECDVRPYGVAPMATRAQASQSRALWRSFSPAAAACLPVPLPLFQFVHFRP